MAIKCICSSSVVLITDTSKLTAFVAIQLSSQVDDIMSPAVAEVIKKKTTASRAHVQC